MSKITPDQIKKRIVISLSVIMAIVGYFRLIQGNTQPVELLNSSLSDSTVPKVEMQIVEPMTIQQDDWHARLAAEPIRPLRRDIFLPAKSMKSVKMKSAANIQQEPLPKLMLRGTVVGEDEPIAMIDDQFIRKNESIAGYKVISIGEKKVVLHSGEKEMILEMLQNDKKF